MAPLISGHGNQGGYEMNSVPKGFASPKGDFTYYFPFQGVAAVRLDQARPGECTNTISTFSYTRSVHTIYIECRKRRDRGQALLWSPFWAARFICSSKIGLSLKRQSLSD